DIPDDVAAILVRMMAKDPKARYQTAGHLFQQLMFVAQKLGGVGDARPDGVVFMDAPLPSPPRPRPVLMAVIATGILVVLVGLLSCTPHHPPRSGMDPNGTFVGVPTTAKSSASPTADAQPSRPAPDGGNRTVAEQQPPQHTYEAETPVLADVAKFV